jgi:hypothetical protein
VKWIPLCVIGGETAVAFAPAEVQDILARYGGFEEK